MKRKLRNASAWLFGLACLVACTPEPAVDEGPPLQPVVVYAAYDDKTYLPALFNQFTAATGYVVIVRNGTVPAIVDDVIGSRVSPPADVLLTPSVLGVWRAAEEGALRPNYSEIVASHAPAWLQDPDKFWVALSYRNASLVFDANQVDADDLKGYATLADEVFRRKLCLSSSTLAINRAVIAMLIRKLGVRETELAVRGWVANLAMPVFDSEQQLMDALASGDCAVGIVSSSSVAQHPDSALQSITPLETYAEIEGIGIARHARNPDGAIMLVDWLLSDEIQARHATALSVIAVTANPENGNQVAHVAAGDEDARKLAERARYR